jgi:hypothetical protein
MGIVTKVRYRFWSWVHRRAERFWHWVYYRKVVPVLPKQPVLPGEYFYIEKRKPGDTVLVSWDDDDDPKTIL